ncbi:energy transducer TonB [Sulfurisoma sediminicola]|uniref:Outer membrane transport energization protein TonB n=1 Tax=Sulfurisoma sediminicola TaxID=1381557 RepID=A0A497XM46_9PROT|nr:energy transducer TonB [Sulfurisoma sediminicola]RLJ68487.1 outer membrane transport energization protein TonB [Sulfurisoma sediminicola]
MPLHIALVLSFFLHLAAYALADWAGLLAPQPSVQRMSLEATLILPDIPSEPPAEPPADPMPPEPPLATPTPERPPPAPAPVAALSQPQAELKPANKSAPPEFYPYEAVRRGLEGEALVAVTLDGRGRVVGAQLERGSGHAILDQAAVRAALSLKSVPGGSGETMLPVSFRLK